MINPQQLFSLFQQNGLNFYTGVPDSLLKDFCAYISDNTTKGNNIITVNEGNALALASGYHLATGKTGVVYMQNSGLGNCINPLTSLTDKDVYSIPTLLIVGWRGEPEKKDEPQHVKMGKITLPILETLGVPYSILPDSIEEAIPSIQRAISYMNSEKSPYALVIKKGTFETYSLQNKKETSFPLNREEAIKIITPLLEESSIIISTTGKTSRELFEFRESLNEEHEKDFLTVGSMGHSSSIALGIALQKPEKIVYCFDGDGALLMHMGSLAIIGDRKPKNFKHIIFNNFAHDSVGGQPTAADAINIPEIAKANGYKAVFTAETTEEVINKIKEIKTLQGPILLEIRCNKGARKDLGRPTRTPLENKNNFMRFLKD